MIENSLNPSQAPLEQRIQHYVIERELGRGAMGVVYLARDTNLNESVAIKLLLNEGDVEDSLRFKREREVMASLRHPGIVQIRYSGRHANNPFFVMECVEGGDLAERLRTTEYTIEQTAQMAAKIADALDFAHKRTVVHRDLKPQNIMLDGDEPKLADFGLSRRKAEAERLTRTGALLGTPKYMAPEQVIGGEVDARTDVYALGAIIYEMLTKCQAVEGATLVDCFDAIQNKTPTLPSRHNPAVPKELDTIVMGCLRKDPNDRWSSAGDVRDMLYEFLEPKTQHVSSRKWVLPALVTLAGVVCGGLSLAYRSRDAAPPPVSSAEVVSNTPVPPTDRKTLTPSIPVVEVPTPVPETAGPTMVQIDGPNYTILDRDGVEMGRGAVSSVNTPFRRMADDYVVEEWAIGDVDGDGVDDIVLTARHRTLFPAMVMVVDVRGGVRRRYCHPGNLGKLLLCDVDADGIQDIFVSGLNNYLADTRGSYVPVVFRLDGRTLDSNGPTKRDRIGSGTEVWYTVLSDQRGKATTLHLEGDMLQAQVRNRSYLVDVATGHLRE